MEDLTDPHRQLPRLWAILCNRFMVKVGLQVERGAFSEDATTKLFGKGIDFVPCIRLREVSELVTQDNVEFGVGPLENSQAGSINDAYALL